MGLCGYCQVDDKLVDRPPRYWARASREPAMLGIRNGRQPQLESLVVSLAIRGDRRIRFTGVRAISWPRFESAPRIRVSPHWGCSTAIRTTRAATSRRVIGRPRPRRALPSDVWASLSGTSGRIVSGVTRAATSRSYRCALETSMHRRSRTATTGHRRLHASSVARVERGKKWRVSRASTWCVIRPTSQPISASSLDAPAKTSSGCRPFPMGHKPRARVDAQ